MNRLQACVLATLALLLGACSSTSGQLEEIGEVTVSSIQKAGIALPASGTYSFARGSGVRWSVDSERQAVDQAFREAFDAAMVDRRWRRISSEAATLRIAYVVGLDEELKPDEMPDRFGLSSDWVTEPSEGRAKGSIVVLAADGLTGDLLWRGALTGMASRTMPLEQRVARIRELAARMVAELPLGSR
ncbi:DUF4136 domain-containing protein [Engelhardtia mirabilis]|uniref:DUF4136 domain-containing protein n=1 Tax=Engelhardtia mirabilis TaxID=2528011 RepID=A0A518BHT9_9BACT|nr:hypothetical protein Pla133_15770 [Planctomycetes bacterium Pla133]QDV00829.1 hypothetical protein Pla86_15760 [Planctomycetes bacterium Pla86]